MPSVLDWQNTHTNSSIGRFHVVSPIIPERMTCRKQKVLSAKRQTLTDRLTDNEPIT